MVFTTRFALDLSKTGTSSTASEIAGGWKTAAANAVTLNGTAFAFGSMRGAEGALEAVLRRRGRAVFRGGREGGLTPCE